MRGGVGLYLISRGGVGWVTPCLILCVDGGFGGSPWPLSFYRGTRIWLDDGLAVFRFICRRSGVLYWGFGYGVGESSRCGVVLVMLDLGMTWPFLRNGWCCRWRGCW